MYLPVLFTRIRESGNKLLAFALTGWLNKVSTVGLNSGSDAVSTVRPSSWNGFDKGSDFWLEAMIDRPQVDEQVMKPIICKSHVLFFKLY